MCKTKIYKGVEVIRDDNGYLVQNKNGDYVEIGKTWFDTKEYLDTEKPDADGKWPLVIF
jgi:hypothetical protein